MLGTLKTILVAGVGLYAYAALDRRIAAIEERETTEPWHGLPPSRRTRAGELGVSAIDPSEAGALTRIPVTGFYNYR